MATNNSNSYENQEINLTELLDIVISNKFWIILVTSVSVVISLFIAQILPYKYVSSILFVPADESSDINNLANQYGGLASLAGVTLPQGNIDKSDIGIEVLKSRLFISNFIEKNNILIPMMAAKSWDYKTNQLIINQDIYDKENKQWVRNVSPPKKSKPSLNEAYDFWKKNIFTVFKDQSNGLITIKITHYSPYEAKRWAELLFEDLNNYLRLQDINEADLSIDYLYEEAKNTDSKELKEVFYSLIESQTKTKMLAFARKDYRFKIIDPPIVAEKRSSPNKIRIMFTGLILGLIFGIFFSVYRNHKKIIK